MKNFILKTMLVVASIYFGVIISNCYQFMHNELQNNSKEVLIVKPGTTIKQIAEQLQARKIIASSKLLCRLAWWQGNARNIKAGEYLIEPKLTPVALLEKLVTGKVIQHSFTIIPGWNVQQLFQALQNEKNIMHTLPAEFTPAVIAKLIEVNKENKFFLSLTNLEGIFWPDTYFYPAGTTEVELLIRAAKTMQDKLLSAWNSREQKLLLAQPYQALILASIVEKEAHILAEYSKIAGVYYNRLQRKMLLQADPTVIYAWQQTAARKMLLKRADLTIASHYNTYVTNGLPPTPIAFPSGAALHAVLHPTITDALYFVASGDGGHVFSVTLAEHNQAVATYKNRNNSKKN